MNHPEQLSPRNLATLLILPLSYWRDDEIRHTLAVLAQRTDEMLADADEEFDYRDLMVALAEERDRRKMLGFELADASTPGVTVVKGARILEVRSMRRRRRR